MDVISPLKINKIVYGGQGLARHEGKVIFIPFTISEEKVTVKITQSKKNYANAELLRIIDPSPERIAPRCEHYTKCGGCQFQHMDYHKQLETKKEILIENLGSHIDPSSIEMIGLPAHSWNYRQHIKITYQEGVLGYHGHSNKNIFELKMCPIFLENLEHYLKRLKHAFSDHNIFQAEIRLLKSGDSLIAAIKCDDADPEIFNELLDTFIGVSVKSQSTRKDFGNCYLSQTYLGKNFEMDVWSFMQCHRTTAELLYKYVLDQIPIHTKFLADLYCGAGILSILASKSFPKILGIELNPSSIECAKNNQINNKASNIQFLACPAEHVLNHTKEKIDFAIINPPREGLSPLMLNELLKMEDAQFCYVSCNPTTLNRDIKKFKEAGYKVESVKGFDMFPQTTHLETVCILRKQR